MISAWWGRYFQVVLSLEIAAFTKNHPLTMVVVREADC